DREQKVDVTVNFPQGRITEWYPQLSAADPRAFAARPNAIQWLGVKVLPLALNSALAKELPTDKSGSHYYAARETDAGFLHVAANANSQMEIEKFLFYRGVGNFTAPLNVQVFGANDEGIQLQNTGTEPLANLFVIHIGQAGAKFLSVDRLAASANKQVLLHPGKNLRPTGEVIAELAQRMTAALVKEGLYEREAAAMVQTWRDSWFAETGVRVLYTLPRAWTDRTLPLTLEPKPREIQRVIVGRAEVLTPTMEWSLLKQVVHYSEADDATRPQVVADTRALGLGRFLEPTTRRLMGKVPGRDFSTLAWELMQAASKPAPAEKSVALK
ncbi:MAG: hypothetical protein HY300_03235, partial [Verrucomicrobia bacterium]|nr:hypothetical protein [Verrucomicrobiota bacterium]